MELVLDEGAAVHAVLHGVVIGLAVLIELTFIAGDLADGGTVVTEEDGDVHLFVILPVAVVNAAGGDGADMAGEIPGGNILQAVLPGGT